MFCYQQKFTSPCETVGRELFHSLFASQQTRWLVETLRSIKEAVARGDTDFYAKVCATTEYQKFRAKMMQRKATATNWAAWDEDKRLLAYADSLKKSLPALMFQAREFDITKSGKGHDGRWRKQAAVRLSGLVVMDIDHVESFEIGGLRIEIPEFLGNHEKRDEVRLSLKTQIPNLNPQILLVYITPSGHGLKVVFKARTEWGNLIDNQRQMAKLLGVEVDESCKDASRMSFIATENDILYINEDELFNYENKEFAEKYNDIYRSGNSQPTLEAPLSPSEGGTIVPASKTIEAPSGAVGGGLKYHTLEWYLKVIDCWLGHKQPEVSERHKTSLILADHLRYVCDNDAKEIEAVLREVPFVKDIVAERNEDVAQTVKSAMQYNFYRNIPKRLQAALAEAVAGNNDEEQKTEKTDAAEVVDDMQARLEEWGAQIATFFDDYPCLREACSELRPAGYPASMFVAAALLGTLMTRTWYHFYHRPEVERRLNYCIMIIGDPASGKSFATRLYDILAAPIRTADQVGYDALNKYKRDVKERSTSSKEQKKEAIVRPEPVIRDHPSRTSNAIFLADMHNAVEEVVYKNHSGGMYTKRLYLHLLTFDSELDNSIANQKGGSWIDKQSLELKAFHNETDGQAYANLDAVMGMFKVYWNFIYTGTPLSLQHKVTERNFGSGLATRLAVILLPPGRYQMMELNRTTKRDVEGEELLKQWAFRLDEVRGELPLWPLVEETWNWANEQMAIAEVNSSKADELLLKRVPYYGIAITAPFILMRHWDEWQQNATFQIDDTDKKLCRLVLNIQYSSQKYFFEDYAQKYFEEMRASYTRHKPKFEMAFSTLPQEFTIDDIANCFGIKKKSASVIASRLVREGRAENKSQQGSFSLYKKL